ncbi:MAG: hypothetical protein FJ104_01850 [Deltaproteobacteria bacterium]|nr:hypothetical protein [Deltaproteobacteria bacterium]
MVQRSSLAARVAGAVLAASLAVAAVVLPLAGCAADHAEAPDPEVTTPGSFLAVPSGEGDFTLMRTLEVYRLAGGEAVLTVRAYRERAASRGAARELARRRDLEVEIPELLVDAGDLYRAEVVGYRSLGAEELTP